MSVSSLRAFSSAFSHILRRKGWPSVSAACVVSGIRSEMPFCRPLSSRSLWYMATYSPRTNYLAQAGGNSQMWRKNPVCGLHTAGDKELADFLKDEIKHEKEIEKKSGKLQKIKNFEVTKTDGPNVELTRKMDHEIITVKFNVNNSVEDAAGGMEGEQQQQDEEQGSQMVSRPAFVVEINKGGDKTLAIHCVFPDTSDSLPPSEHEQNEYEDAIEIQDVTLLNKSQEWTDDVYTLSSSIMDGNLYDMLLNMLEERGIDGDFIDHVLDFSTSYEHKRYIELLEQLKDFAESK